MVAWSHPQVEADSAILRHLMVQAHPGVIVRGDRACLDTPHNFGVGMDSDGRGMVSVRYTPAVREALAKTRDPIRCSVLAAHLQTTFGAAASDAAVNKLLVSLVEQDFLITNLRPPLDGREPLAHVISVLTEVEQRSRSERPDLAHLRMVAAARDDYDRTAIGEGLPTLEHLAEAAGRLRPATTAVHVDTRLGLTVHLPDEVRQEAERLVTVLWRLSPHRLGMRPLRKYHLDFLERYGVGRVVPVLELLDEAAGLGAPAGYTWPASEASEESATEVRSRQRERIQAALVAEALRDGRHEVVIDDALIEELSEGPGDVRDVPASCELYLHVVAPTVSALSTGDFRIVVAPNPGSHHAGATFSRFLDLLDEHRDKIAELCCSAPPRVSGALPANIVFQPRSDRAGNIAHTPALTGRRISIGLPDSDRAAEIRLDEIGISATLDRLYAVHLPTGRELAPVAHHMISPGAQAPNAARLLWEIGMEGSRLWEPWDWGTASSSPFLPRVRYGRSVLCPATWKLDELRISLERHAGKRRGAPVPREWREDVQRWRQRWRVPAQILVLSTDQRLLLDLTNPWHIELLAEEIRKDDNLVAQEQPGGAPESDGWLRDSSGRYFAEVVVPLRRRPGLPEAEPARFTALINAEPKRRQGPGGEWLYLKLYGPWRGQDGLLRERIPHLVAAAMEAGADRWFFIRYSEAGHHLRVRFHGGAEVLWTRVLPAVTPLLRTWQEQRLLRHVQIDEYDPEWERYGGPEAQAAAEQVFQADSEAAITLLTLCHNRGFAYDLDTVSAVSLASLAHAFGPPSEAPWFDGGRGARDDAAAAWLAATGSRRETPPGFRQRRKEWSDLIDPTGGWSKLLADDAGPRVLDALRKRDQAVARYAELINDLDRRDACPTPPVRIVGSLLHMTCNRLFGGHPNREQNVTALARCAVLANYDRRRHAA